MKKSGLGVRLLMLGTVELWEDERSMISLLFLEYFLVALPIGLTPNVRQGRLEKGLIINASLTSLSRSLTTVSGPELAEDK